MSSASTCWIKSVFIVGLAPPDRSVRIWGLFGSNTATAFASQFMFSCDIHRYVRRCMPRSTATPSDVARLGALANIRRFYRFPHAILTSGARDLFLSLTMLTHRKLRRASVEAELIYEGMSHAQYNFDPMKAATAGFVPALPCLPSPRSFQRGCEISQIWRWLVLARRHQKTVRA